jgi:hypothetical protein
MNDDRFPDDLEPIAQRLTAGREQDPIALDQLKHRLMAAGRPRSRRFPLMKSRIATVLTVLGLLGGTGGAVALATTASSHGPTGGAADGQYHHHCPHHRPHCMGRVPTKR